VLLPLLVGAALALTPEDAQVILQIEAQRLPPLALARFVASEDAPTRARAARALGRLRSASSLAPLKRLVADDDPEVRAEAAFALGHTPGAGRALLEALTAPTDDLTRRRLVTALGHQGDDAAVAELRKILGATTGSLKRPWEAIAAAHALGRMAMRDVPEARSGATTTALLGALDRIDVRLQRAAAFALARQKPLDLDPTLAAAIQRSAHQAPDRDARAFLVRAAGSTGADSEDLQDSLGALLADLADDPDLGVRVAIARASVPAAWPGVTALLADPEPSVRLEAIAAVGRLDDIDRVALLQPLIDAGSDLKAAEAWRTVADPRLHEATAALAALAPAGLVPDLAPYIASERPTRIRVAAVSGMDDVMVLSGLARDDGEGSVRTSAALRLVELEPGRAALVDLLGAFDPVVAAIGAEALAETPSSKIEGPLLDCLEAAEHPDLLALGMDTLAVLYEGERPKVKKPKKEGVELARANLDHPSGLVRAAARGLLEAVGEEPGPPWHHIVNAPLDEAVNARTARLHTSRGEVILQLLPEEAPLTVWNFAKLADDGWFDRLSFHRVVPDFVVQTGDPRGDGMGGPAWTIPDEINPVPYDAGVVGMALSGPDTGGSQWFITLSPQPHLDGTYTVFGRVVQGMAVLRNLREGDRVEALEIEWSGDEG
jgi:cyclophilin family peptidyl-prolyl cis-trans isomerase/HEAT repeat protein